MAVSSEGVELRLDVDEAVTPVALSLRRVSLHSRKDVDTQLEQLLASDMIESVCEPSVWASFHVCGTRR